eukprot:COSAG05_NODE_23931_length_255_cov_0.256410_1_plen_57_part_10
MLWCWCVWLRCWGGGGVGGRVGGQGEVMGCVEVFHHPCGVTQVRNLLSSGRVTVLAS